MTARSTSRARKSLLLPGGLIAATGLVASIALAVTLGAGEAGAAQAPVDLGTATSFAVLAGSTVTNTGPSVINGDLGVSPGTAVTGIKPPTAEPGTVNGVVHSADSVAAQAQLDESTGYTTAAGRSPVTNVAVELGGSTLVGGVYASNTLGLTGTLTLSGDSSAVWIFRAASTLITASASKVLFTGGANACNVFWQIGSSATIGTASAFAGTVLAHTSISAETGATVQGRLFAQTGAVTLDTNVITRPSCATGPTGGGSSTTGTGTGSTGSTGSSGSAGAGGGGSTVTGAPANVPGAVSPAGGNGHANGAGAVKTGSSTSPNSRIRTNSTSHRANNETATNLRTTTELSTTGSNIISPLIGGLLAVILGGFVLYLARRQIITAKHRR